MHHDHNTSNEDTREDVAENDSKTEFRYDISRRNLLRRSLKGGMALGAAAAAMPLALGGASEAEAQTAPEPPAGARPPRPPRPDEGPRPPRPDGRTGAQAVTFFGERQAGIVTAPPTRLRFVTLDLATSDRTEVAAMFQRWTDAASRLTTGGTTVTLGLGASFFDRLSLQPQRPSRLTALPAFAGDALVAGYTDGDLALQVCAADDATATAAVAELRAQSAGLVTERSTQVGFRAATARGETGRNLMGFKDGTVNPPFADGLTADQVLWVGSEGPAWLQGGSYLVMRRIRLDLAAWEQTSITAQEAVIGRDKETGAPLTGTRERDRADFGERDAAGNLVIPADAHIRRARPRQNGGARILRRGYNYQDAANDAGLIFLSYQRDPQQFVRIQQSLAASDALNRFSTTLGSGLWAILPGVTSGHWLGEGLLG